MNRKNEEKNKVKVQILNKEYTIKTKGQTPEYVVKLASVIDEQMKLVRTQNPVLSRDDIALLTALNIADELFKIKQDYDELVRLIEENKGI